MPVPNIAGPLIARVRPWPKPALEECHFYHSIDLPDGSSVNGAWDLRGRFPYYIGGVDVRGKSVFDMGTATGFLAFSAEQHGASSVLAFDMDGAHRSDRVPYKDNLHYQNKAIWAESRADRQRRQKNSFWHLWHARRSAVEVCYGSIESLLSIGDRFDVVLAGAIVEHLADPVTPIGAACRLARETVVVAFTSMHDSDDEFMKPLIPWDRPDADVAWWALSRGLYRRIFANMGFAIEIVPCEIERHGAIEPRKTIIARRLP